MDGRGATLRRGRAAVADLPPVLRGRRLARIAGAVARRIVALGVVRPVQLALVVSPRRVPTDPMRPARRFDCRLR